MLEGSRLKSGPIHCPGKGAGSAISFLGLAWRAEATPAATAMRIDHYRAAWGIDRTGAEHGGEGGDEQQTEQQSHVDWTF